MKKKAQCEHCGKSFDRRGGYLWHHIRTVHKINIVRRDPSLRIGKPIIRCPDCDATFTNRSSLYNHRAKKHRNKIKKIVPRPKNDEEVLVMSPEEANSLLETFPNYESGKYSFVRVGNRKRAGCFIEVKFRITDIVEAVNFKQEYEENNAICLRISSNQCSSKKNVIYKKKFQCWHCIKPSKSKHSDRHTNCPFRFHIKVQEENSELYTYVRLVEKHNHDVAKSVKFRSPSEVVKDKFLCLFNYGFLPAKAYKIHLKDMKEEFVDDFDRIANDRFYCPDFRWVQRIHDGIFKKKLEKQYSLQMHQNLVERVEEFAGAKMHALDGVFNYVISIVTPFMKRVQMGFKENAGMIFMDSSGWIDLINCKVFTLMTSSCAGSVPVALIITTVDSHEAVRSGLSMIQELTANAFNPSIFVINQNPFQRAALQQVFPESTLLLCQICVLQAVWRYIWNTASNIDSRDRPQLFYSFKALVYEKSLESFVVKMSTFIQSEELRKYPSFSSYLEDYWTIKEDWATCYRAELVSKNQSRNSFCEASMRITREIILERFSPYSTLHLFTILTREFEEYYVNKLRSLYNGKVPEYLLPGPKRINEKLNDLKYDDDTRVVHNEKEGSSYRVYSDICVCSCPMGMDGKLCEHLFLVLKHAGPGVQTVIPENQKEKKKLYCIVNGKKPVNPERGWFANLSHETNHVIEDQSSLTAEVDPCSSPSPEEETVEVEHSDSIIIDEPIFNYSNEWCDALVCQVETKVTDVEYALRAVNEVFDDTIQKVRDNPCLVPAVMSFVAAYHNIKTVSELEGALFNFGRGCHDEDTKIS